MSGAGTRLGVGTHFRLDGETVEVVEFASLATGMEVVLRDGRDRLARMSLRELLTSDRAELIHDRAGPSSTDDEDLAAVVLNRLTKDEKKDVLERAEHVREMLTGYRSGSEDLPRTDEPRPQYAPGLPLRARYEAKAAELGVTERTVRRWARAFQELGEAGLVPKTARTDSGLGNADPRWVEAAEEVLKEYEEESRPSVKVVLEEVEARVRTKFKVDRLQVPFMASNFGAPHTLVEQSTFFTYFEYSDDELESIGVPRGTVRLALGYNDDVTDIVKDLDQALSHSLSRNAPTCDDGM